jgi:hypothetical protein
MLTSLSPTCIPELLQTTTDLFGCPCFARLFKDPVGNKSISHRKATKQPSLSRVIWLVILETWGGPSANEKEIINQISHLR